MAEPKLEELDGKYTGQMHILDETGDTKIAWDRNDPDSVATAKAAYDKAKAAGYWAYEVKKNGDKGERTMIREFDPNAEAVILAPQLRGG